MMRLRILNPQKETKNISFNIIENIPKIYLKLALEMYHDLTAVEIG